MHNLTGCATEEVRCDLNAGRNPLDPPTPHIPPYQGGRGQASTLQNRTYQG